MVTSSETSTERQELNGGDNALLMPLKAFQTMNLSTHGRNFLPINRYILQHSHVESSLVVTKIALPAMQKEILY